MSSSSSGSTGRYACRGLSRPERSMPAMLIIAWICESVSRVKSTASRKRIALPVRRVLARVRQPGPQQDVALGGRRCVRGGHGDREAAERVAGVACDRDGLGRVLEERSRQVPPLGIALAAEQQRHLLRVAAARAVHAVAHAPLPAVEGADLRGLDELGEVDRQHRLPAHGTRVEAVGDAPAQLVLALRLALEQVRPQRPAHEVVEREPAAERLGEAARLEPAHGLRGVGLGQHVTQQLERRHARDAGHAEHVAVAALDLGLSEPAHERPHHLAGLARPRAPAAVLNRGCGERERERRAARPVRQLVAAGAARGHGRRAAPRTRRATAGRARPRA